MSISQPAERSTLLLLSGGLDSSTLAFFLAKKHERIRGIFVDFGQGNSQREVESARQVWRLLTDAELDGESRFLPGLIEVSVRDWRDGYKDFEIANSAVEMGFLPRNLLLTLLALPYARLEGCKWIALGSTTEDGGMPDSNEDFAESANRLLRQMNQYEEIAVPWLWESDGWDKARIATWAKGNTPEGFLDATWSCYSGGQTPCGSCGACRKRELALRVVS